MEIQEDDTQNKLIFSNIITKIRAIFKKIRYSEVLKIQLKNFCAMDAIDFVVPTLDVKTRWNSTYDMLFVANRLEPALSMFSKVRSELENFKLSNLEWQCLRQMLKYLKYFKYISTEIGKENDVTLPSAVVLFNMLIDKVESIIF